MSCLNAKCQTLAGGLATQPAGQPASQPAGQPAGRVSWPAGPAGQLAGTYILAALGKISFKSASPTIPGKDWIGTYGWTGGLGVGNFEVHDSVLPNQGPEDLCHGTWQERRSKGFAMAIWGTQESQVHGRK